MKTKTMSRGAVLLAALLAVSLPSLARAHDARDHGAMNHDTMDHGATAQVGIAVTGAWARPTIGRLRVTAAYFQAAVTGKDADRLTGARTPVAAHAELHEHVMQNDVARMRPVAGVPVAPGKPATFRPGGYHVMIKDLKQPLNEGDTFPLTLTFEIAGDVTVQVTVMKKAAMDHGMHRH